MLLYIRSIMNKDILIQEIAADLDSYTDSQSSDRCSIELSIMTGIIWTRCQVKQVIL
jgi:hypothetical protein